MSAADKFEVRALTRGELKKLRKNGVNIAAMDEDNPVEVEDTIDAVMDMVFGNQVKKIDEEPNTVTLELFHRIVEATYETPGQSKNSSAPGTGIGKAGRKGAPRAGRKTAKRAKKRR